MNAPLTPDQQQALHSVTLDDKYTLAQGRAFMSGVQALVRLPMLQRQRDALAGLNTAGFISGYRGSPLGGYDQALWAARKHLQQEHVVFQPGVNEELAATAVWGTQQLDIQPDTKKYDGVFGIWYGKGPGVDRSGDVFKHANMAGTARHGGVIAVAGDDHIAKSSTAAHQSDHIFKACGLPVFYPASVQDILDLGLHAFALSRYAGLWASMKTVQEVVESSASVDVGAGRVRIALPEDFAMPDGGLHIRWPDAPLEQEARLMNHKWYAALAYIRANRLNHNVIEGPRDRFGIIASGKAYGDMRQALVDLGLDDATCRQLGIRVHKVGVVWPLEPAGTQAFARGLQEVLVVEEKRQMIEYQLKEELYHWPDGQRPRVLGKFDEEGGEWSQPNPGAHWLLRAQADLSPALIARAIAQRLKALGVPDDVARRMDERLAQITAREQALAAQPHATGERLPWFCSGCPHNTSTRVPEGSRALAGIGCHYMANWMPDRRTATFTQMGGEGVTWVGQAPFTQEAHVFANLGDGTYFHSGLLAIRQSVAAGVNITYKILYNDAVAMTGGQQVGERPEGHSVAQIAHSLRAEGVARLVVVTDEPEKYRGRTHPANAVRAGHPELIDDLPAGVEVFHRDALDRIQRELREVPGCTALIYDQTCATEKRRRRKRGLLATPAKTVVINELVCEGCGDCSEASNCLSVEPVETPFGRKRRINQNSCNKDFSCVNGFCPSFVTVEGGQLKKPRKEQHGQLETMPPLPESVAAPLDGVWHAVVAGVGGTGVITIGQLLGMAAHLEGLGVATQDAAGLAQKGGATWSHIQVAPDAGAIHATRVDVAQADLVVGCDAIVAAHAATLAVMQRGRTHVALNNHATPTAALVHDPDWQFPLGGCEAALADAVGRDRLGMFDAERVAARVLGDSIYTNPLLLGYAWQKGWVPLTLQALMRAMELNGVQVDNNQAAFAWGRHCAAHPQQMQALLAAEQVIQVVKKPSLHDMVAERVQFLTDYQNAGYAQQYSDFVDKVQAAEAALDGASGTRLAEAVARYLFKLMAYKDEYEVARLHTDAAFVQSIGAMFEGDVKLVHHLAPPLWARKKDGQGRPAKSAYGPWVRPAFKMLARLKGLRGTPFDPFGHSAERRTERALVREYRACIDELLAGLSPERLALAVQIARIPEGIRGYGRVKERHLQAARAQWGELMGQWRAVPAL